MKPSPLSIRIPIFDSGSCPSQSSRFNHPGYIRWTLKTMKFLIVEPSPLPILIPLGPNIPLRILFSNTLSLHSSLNTRNHVLQTYTTTSNIVVLYLLIFKFLETSREDKTVWTKKITLISCFKSTFYLIFKILIFQ